MNYPNFMSEHSAEYVLVPDLVKRFESLTSEIIPMFFWSTREGNSTSRGMMARSSVKIISAFARRPKLSPVKDHKISFKINEELINYSHMNKEFGISVLAGVPLAQSLFDIRLNTPCCWYKIDGFTECMIDIDMQGNAISSNPTQAFLPIRLTDQQLCDMVSSSKQMSWVEAVEIIRHIKRAYRAHRGGYFSFFGIYQPFHLIFPTIYL
ncbi:MAG TPA: hypothetical protein VGO50_08085 [Pyrinomonadaceae bacterium]|jgi:hypothetical protein|nr:hypothetical protein [Pyrinomonadaceae bacterium]